VRDISLSKENVADQRNARPLATASSYYANVVEHRPNPESHVCLQDLIIQVKYPHVDDIVSPQDTTLWCSNGLRWLHNVPRMYPHHCVSSQHSARDVVHYVRKVVYYA